MLDGISPVGGWAVFWLQNAQFWTPGSFWRVGQRTGTKPSCWFVHPKAQEEVFQEPMQRSLIILTIATVLSASGAIFAQTPPTAEPKSASGIPQANTTPANPPATNSAPAPATPATVTPSPTPAVNQKEVPQSTSSVPASTTPSPAPNAPGKTGNSDKSVPSTSAAPSAPQQPQQPKTEILDSSATSAVSNNGRDPILDPPPFPSGNATLVGGIIRDVDHVRNRMAVAVFGGGRWTVFFDERTHIFRNGAETTQMALKKGERVYVDTMLDGTRHDIFARNIRVGVSAPPADADGQIIAVDTAHGELTLRDSINSVPVHFGVDKETRISSGATPVTLNQVKAGALVHVKFSPASGNRGVAREIIITAAPGAAFTFLGTLTFLDVHRGLLAIHNVTDNKNYDIHFRPERTQESSNLGVGSNVRIIATFEGTRYTAQSITLTDEAGKTQKD
jgi:hypothetical protein